MVPDPPHHFVHQTVKTPTLNGAHLVSKSLPLPHNRLDLIWKMRPGLPLYHWFAKYYTSHKFSAQPPTPIGYYCGYFQSEPSRVMFRRWRRTSVKAQAGEVTGSITPKTVSTMAFFIWKFVYNAKKRERTYSYMT